MSDSLRLRHCRQTVSDLAWTPDGTSLLVSSSDSTMAVLRFEAAEIGEALSQVHSAASIATVKVTCTGAAFGLGAQCCLLCSLASRCTGLAGLMHA